MGQRIITGLGLIAILLVLLYFGGVVMCAAVLICVCISVYEEQKALRGVGQRAPVWPTWVGILLGIPGILVLGAKVVLPLLAVVCGLNILCVLLREEPRLEDILTSTMPTLTIVMPGLCVMAIAQVQPLELQRILLIFLFVIPVACDTLAYFIGSWLRGPKLCPKVSPNKTVSGAVAGMAGALLAAVIIGAVAKGTCSSAVQAQLPGWGAIILLGVIGGIAGQLGDLFASMVKRYCGIKDFSNLFPAHGGMLDRLDSILFMAIVMYCFHILM